MSKLHEIVLSGGCRCGAVTYTSSKLPTDACNCHCITCRKLSGGPYMTFLNFSAASITWTGDMSSLGKTHYSDVAERAHCRKCGSPIYMNYNHEPNRMGIAAGSIDEDSLKGVLPKPDHHIFVAEMADWFDLPTDGLSRHAYHTDSFQKKLDTLQKD